MPSQHLADPLQRFPVFSTSDPEEFRDALLTRFGATRAEVKYPAGLLAKGNLVQLHSIGLVYGACSSAVSVNYPEADRFRMLSAVTGKGQAAVGSKTVALDTHQSCIVSPGQSTGLTTEAGHDWFNLRIDPSAFERSLPAMIAGIERLASIVGANGYVEQRRNREKAPLFRLLEQPYGAGQKRIIGAELIVQLLPIYSAAPIPAERNQKVGVNRMAKDLRIVNESNDLGREPQPGVVAAKIRPADICAVADTVIAVRDERRGPGRKRYVIARMVVGGMRPMQETEDENEGAGTPSQA